MSAAENNAVTGKKLDETAVFALSIVLIFVTAAAIRVARLSYSISLDETWVLDLVRRADLRPHAYHMPPLYYIILKLWTLFAGFSNYAMRMPAAVLGVLAALIPFFAGWIAPKTVSRPVALAWSCMLAFSSPLIFYSAMMKQYTLDAFAACLLISIALGAIEKNSLKLWGFFFAVGLLCVGTLYSAVFVVAAVAVAVLPAMTFTSRRHSPSRRQAILFTAGFFFLAIIFLIAYLGFLAPSAETTQRHGDMDAWFTAKGFWLNFDLSQIYAVTRHWIGQAFNLTPLFIPYLGAWIAVWLVWGSDRRKERILVFVLAILPPLAIAAASFLRFFPYGETRLMILAYPSLYLLAAMALFGPQARSKVKYLQTSLGCLMLGAFIFMGIARDPYNSTYMQFHDLRILFNFVAENHQSGERIFVERDIFPSLAREQPNLAKDLKVFDKNAKPYQGFYLLRSSNAAGLNGSPRIHFHDLVGVRIRPGD